MHFTDVNCYTVHKKYQTYAETAKLPKKKIDLRAPTDKLNL